MRKDSEKMLEHLRAEGGCLSGFAGFVGEAQYPDLFILENAFYSWQTSLGCDREPGYFVNAIADALKERAFAMRENGRILQDELDALVELNDALTRMASAIRERLERGCEMEPGEWEVRPFGVTPAKNEEAGADLPGLSIRHAKVPRRVAQA